MCHLFSLLSNFAPYVKQLTPRTTEMTFRTERRVPRLGVMLVGWGGNNGTTVTAAVLANKLGLTWRTKNGVKKANYFGSLLQSSTVCVGSGPEGEVGVPFRDLLPMVHPNDIVFDGMDNSLLKLRPDTDVSCVRVCTRTNVYVCAVKSGNRRKI